MGNEALSLRAATSFEVRFGILRDRLLRHGQRHPQGPQTALLAMTATFGWSRLSIRLSNLPWLALLLAGTFLAARELIGPRGALLAMWLAGTLPVVVHMSRKWFPHFFAACLAPLALWLVIVVARRLLAPTTPGARPLLGPLLALAAVQAARLFCHPIGVPDVALLYLLLGGIALARRRAALPALLGSAALCALVGAPALFAGALVEGQVGLAEYLDMVQGFLSAGWLLEGPGAWARVATDLARRAGLAVLWPAGLLVLLPGVGGLLLPRGTSSLLLRLLVLRLALHLPVIVLTVGNDAFLADYLFLAPDLCVLLAAGLLRLARRSGQGRLVIGLAVLQGAVSLIVPLALGAATPNGLAEGAFGGRIARPFTRSEHGHLDNTHLIPLRGEQIGAAMARRLDPERPRTILVHDLLHTTADCGTGGLGPGEWRWEARDPGFSAIPGGDPFEERWQERAPSFVLAAGVEPRGLGVEAPGEAPQGPGADAAGTHLVRLWISSVPDGPAERECVLPPEALRALLAAAEAIVGGRFAGRIERFDDPAGWCVAAPRPLAEPVPGYLRASLLVRP